jgi:hypothetical protein
MINIGTTSINKPWLNWWQYVKDSMLIIQSLIQYVDGIITTCIELALGLFWNNLDFFNTHSMDEILSMLRQHKLINYWVDVVTTFIKVNFQCYYISHKINTLKMLKWYSLSQHWYNRTMCCDIKWENNNHWFNVNQIFHFISVKSTISIVLTLIHSNLIQHCIYIVPTCAQHYISLTRIHMASKHRW